MAENNKKSLILYEYEKSKIKTFSKNLNKNALRIFKCSIYNLKQYINKFLILITKYNL